MFEVIGYIFVVAIVWAGLGAGTIFWINKRTDQALEKWEQECPLGSTFAGAISIAFWPMIGLMYWWKNGRG